MIKVYDFSCITCGHTFESFVRVESGVIECPECPKCKNETVKIPSTYNFVIRRVRYDSVANQWDYSQVKEGT